MKTSFSISLSGLNSSADREKSGYAEICSFRKIFLINNSKYLLNVTPCRSVKKYKGRKGISIPITFNNQLKVCFSNKKYLIQSKHARHKFLKYISY